jgi:hypothetical protein
VNSNEVEWKPLPFNGRNLSQLDGLNQAVMVLLGLVAVVPTLVPGLLALRKSNFPAQSPGVRTPSTPVSLLVEAVVVMVRTNLDAVAFSAFDFTAGDLARGLIK